MLIASDIAHFYPAWLVGFPIQFRFIYESAACADKLGVTSGS